MIPVAGTKVYDRKTGEKLDKGEGAVWLLLTSCLVVLASLALPWLIEGMTIMDPDLAAYFGGGNVNLQPTFGGMMLSRHRFLETKPGIYVITADSAPILLVYIHATISHATS